ncbi:hypothetical protein [Gemella haemolysans]|uniref:hypothetical protein n=1 Tax=Gemella haemolysans TaxID=1379 RepID=UPI0028D619E4|nr:hypothetical protein [Gemella haemolysans]
MRKSYLKGTRILILFTLIVWLFTISAIAMTIKPYFGNFGDKTQNTEKYTTGLGGHSYIKLLAIEETNITDDKALSEGEKFYLVQYEDGYIMMKSTPEKIREILGKYDLHDLVDGKLIFADSYDIYVDIDGVREMSSSGKGRTSKPNVSNKLREKFKKVYEKSDLPILKSPLNNSAWKNEFNEKIYIRTLTTTDSTNSFVFSGIITMIALITTYNVIKRIRTNISSYNTLFYKYPETRYDMDLIVRDANFINKELKILVYKDLLIFYKTTFIVEEISDIEEMLFSKNSAKGKNDHTIIYSTHFDDKNREIKLKSVNTGAFIATAKTLRKNYKMKIKINI